MYILRKVHRFTTDLIGAFIITGYYLIVGIVSLMCDIIEIVKDNPSQCD